MAEDIIKLETQKMASDGLIQKDENSMATILQELDNVFSFDFRKYMQYVIYGG